MGDGRKREENLRCLHEARESFCRFQACKFSGKYFPVFEQADANIATSNETGRIVSRDILLSPCGLIDKKGDKNDESAHVKRQGGVMNFIPADNHIITTQLTKRGQNHIGNEAQKIQNRRRNKSVHTARESKKVKARRKHCKCLVSPPMEECPRGIVNNH